MQTEQKKALIVGTLLALVCSVLVSTVVVKLKPIQDASKAQGRVLQIVAATGIEGEPQDVMAKLKPYIVNLKTGEYKTAENPTKWFDDYGRMIKNPATSDAIPAVEDKALIRLVPHEMLVYVAYDGAEKPVLAVMPVYGTGLYSVLHAYIAMDLNNLTVAGLKFSEHGETPGLGGEIDNPKWQAKWIGKQIYDANGNVKFFVSKTALKQDSPDYKFSVDAISGATLTSRGVDSMVGFWMSEFGYKTFLMQMNKEARRVGR